MNYSPNTLSSFSLKLNLPETGLFWSWQLLWHNDDSITPAQHEAQEKAAMGTQGAGTAAGSAAIQKALVRHGASGWQAPFSPS